MRLVTITRRAQASASASLARNAAASLDESPDSSASG